MTVPYSTIWSLHAYNGSAKQRGRWSLYICCE